MERRSFVRSAGIAGVLAAGAAPAIVQAQANLRWRLASSFPRSLDTLFGVSDVFAKKLSELTGGQSRAVAPEHPLAVLHSMPSLARPRRAPWACGQVRPSSAESADQASERSGPPSMMM